MSDLDIALGTFDDEEDELYRLLSGGSDDKVFGEAGPGSGSLPNQPGLQNVPGQPLQEADPALSPGPADPQQGSIEEIVRGLGSAFLNTGNTFLGMLDKVPGAALAAGVGLPAAASTFEDLEPARAGVQALSQDIGPEDQRPITERITDKPATTVARTVAEAVPSLVGTIAGSAAGTAVAGPPGAIAGGMAFAVPLMGFDSYESAKDAGASEGASVAIGTTVGLVGGLLETIGAKGAGKPITQAIAKEVKAKGAKAVAKGILSGAATEVGTEEAQEIIAMAGEVVAGRTFEEVAAEAGDRLLHAGIGAAGASAGIGTAGAMLPSRASSVEKLIEQVEQRPEVGQQLAALEQNPPAPEVELEEVAKEAKPKPRTMEEWAYSDLPDPSATVQEGQEFESMKPATIADKIEADVLGEDLLVLDALKQVLGKDASNQMERMFSFQRSGTAMQERVLSEPIANARGEIIAPAMKEILSEVAHIVPPDPASDPDPGFFDRYVDPGPKRKLAPSLARDMENKPWLKTFEEMRIILREEELADRAGMLSVPDAPLPAPSLSLDQLINSTEPGATADADAAFTVLESLMESSEKELDVNNERFFKQEPETDLDLDPEAVADVQKRHDWLKSQKFYPELRSAAEKASEWDQHLVSLYEAAGILSNEEAGRIKAKGKHYAGLFVANFSDEINGSLINNSTDPNNTFKKITKGLSSKNKVLPPTASSLRRAQAVHMVARRQVAINAFSKAVGVSPESFESGDIVLVQGKKDIVKQQEAIARGLSPINSYVGGKKQQLYVPESIKQAFYAAPSGFQGEMANIVEDFVSGFTSFRRAMAIETPTFLARVVVRNELEAPALTAEWGEHAYKPLLTAFRGMAERFVGTGFYEEFKRMGGGLGSIVSEDLIQGLGGLGDVALAAESDATGKAMMGRVKTLAREWGRSVATGPMSQKGAALAYPFAKIGQGLDRAARIGQYVQLRQAGYSSVEALHAARRAALDFSAPGRFSKEASKLFLFQGAQAAAFRANKEAVMNHPAKLGSVVANYIVLPEIAHWLVNYDRPEYEDLDEWEKETKYHWGQLDDGSWIVTPRPLGILSKMFGYGFGQLLDFAYKGKKDIPERLLNVISEDVPVVSLLPTVAKPGSALQPGGFGVGLEIDRMLPEISTLPVSLAFNRKPFFDSPVEPEYMRYRGKTERAYKYTPELFRDIAKLTKDTSFEVSPLQLEHVFSEIGGSLGRDAIRSGRLLDKALAGEEIDAADIPGVNAFISRKRDPPAMFPVRRVYELYKERISDKSSDNQMRKDAFRKIETAHKDIRSMVSQYNAYNEASEYEYRDYIGEQIITRARAALVEIGERRQSGESPIMDFF